MSHTDRFQQLLDFLQHFRFSLNYKKNIENEKKFIFTHDSWTTRGNQSNISILSSKNIAPLTADLALESVQSKKSNRNVKSFSLQVDFHFIMRLQFQKGTQNACWKATQALNSRCLFHETSRLGVLPLHIGWYLKQNVRYDDVMAHRFDRKLHFIESARVWVGKLIFVLQLSTLNTWGWSLALMSSKP